MEYDIPTPFLTNCFAYSELWDVLVELIAWMAEPLCCSVHDISGAGLPYAIQLATTLCPVSATISTSSEMGGS